MNPFVDSTNAGFENPKQVKYSQVLPVGTPASAKMVSFKPSNGSSYSPTSNNVIQIPLAYNAFLDPENSYLKFTVTNSSTLANATTGIGVRPDHSAYSFFSTMRLLGPDNSEIDRIGEFPTLMALLNDINLEDGYKAGVGSRLSGFSEKRILGSNQNTILTAQTAGSVLIESFYDDDTFQPRIGAAGSMTYCISLPGLLGSEKYIPLQTLTKGMGGSSLILELTLAPALQVLRTPVLTSGYTDANETQDVLDTHLPSYSVSNVAYMAQTVQFSSTFESMFDSLINSGGVTLHNHAWSHQRIPLASGQTSISIPISARYKSIKSILMVFRANLDLNDTALATYRVGARNNINMASYQFRVGSEMVPPSRVEISDTNFGECLNELLKACGYKIGGLGSRGTGLSGSAFYYNDTGSAYTVGDKSVDAGTQGTETIPAILGKFAVGLDLESYVGNSLESGLNTSDQAIPIQFDATLSSAIVGGGVVADVYVLHDALVNISNQGIVIGR